MPTRYGQGGYDSPFSNILANQAQPANAYAEFAGANREEPLGPFAGFLKGITGHLQQQRDEAVRTQENTKKAALAFLDQIPDSPQNNPIKMRMAMDILQSKPGAKHWSDDIFGFRATNQAAQYSEDLWNRLQTVLPEGPPPPPKPTGPRDLAGMANFVTAPPQMAQTPSQYGGKVDLSAEVGRHIPVGIVSDEQGNKSLVTFDQKTGNPVIRPIGAVTTEKEAVAKIQAQGKIEALDKAAEKGLLTRAFRVAARAHPDGTPGSVTSMRDFRNLPKEAIENYVSAAEEELKHEQELKNQGTVAGTEAKTQSARKSKAIAVVQEKRAAGTLPAMPRAAGPPGSVTVEDKRKFDLYHAQYVKPIDDELRAARAALQKAQAITTSSHWNEMPAKTTARQKGQDFYTKQVQDLQNKVDTLESRKRKIEAQAPRAAGVPGPAAPTAAPAAGSANDPLGIRPYLNK